MLTGSDEPPRTTAEPKPTKSNGKVSAGVVGDSVEMPPVPLLAPPERTPPTKQEALKRADGLAAGFVLLSLSGAAEDGWRWVIEGKDEPSVCE